MLENILTNLFMILTLSSFIILIVEILCLWYCPRRNHFYIRLLCGSILYSLLSFLLLNWETPNYTFIFLLKVLLIFIMSVIVMMFSYKITFKTAIFALFTGYLFSNSHFYITNIMLSSVSSGKRGLLFYSLSFLFLVIYLFAFWLVLLQRLKKFELGKVINNFVISFAVIASLIIHIISVTNSSPSTSDNLYVNVYGAISSISIILLLFSFCLKNKEEEEKETIQTILNKSELKDKKKENISRTIERKAHDLKYQIGAIKTLSKNEEQNKEIYKELQDTEKQIALYDELIDSGNRAIDVAIGDRMELIRSLNINFSYIIDGKQLNFIKSTDIYALLGNILDNAIEALEKENVDNRSMTLKIYLQGDMVIIESDNYCSHIVEFEDGLPKTQKDKSIHGFGTRSIAFMVRKYEGKIKYSQFENTFFIKISFPITSFE